MHYRRFGPQVEMARFDGKPVIITKVADGINKADELVARAAKADAPNLPCW